ncbi:MAG: nucleotide exchange factor GrpE [Cyanobacteriota bacterium]|nr:nucleotide exchange factor GrpE [Cyanobacteriota bacterium]
MTDEQKQSDVPVEPSSQNAAPIEVGGEAEPAGASASEAGGLGEEVAASASTAEVQHPVDGGELSQLVERLKQENEAQKQQSQERDRQLETYKNQLARTAADFDNFRKRTQKEKEDLEHRVKRETIMELLPAVDNFERARSQIKPANDGEMTIHKSYQGVYKDLVNGLKRIGVAAMRPEGQPFDPNYHEAMMQVQTDEYPEDTVIEQLVRGYLLGEKVLRHAMVKVAAPKDPVVPSEEESLTEESALDS